jgi:general secretion pathway protein N
LTRHGATARGRPPAPPARRRSRSTALILLGLLAIAAFVLATLPAGIVISRLQAHGVTADAVSGTIWSGHAQGLVARGAQLGDLQWSLRPASLLRGRLAGHARLMGTEHRLEADFARAWSGRLTVEAANAEFSLASLAALGVPVGRNWRGRLVADVSRLELDGDWPVAATGTIDLHELASPPPRTALLGDYRLTFPAPAAAADELKATVTQTEGPLLLDGVITLSRDRSFLLEGTVAPRGAPSPDLARLLQALGPPDARGRRPFSVSGTY